MNPTHAMVTHRGTVCPIQVEEIEPTGRVRYVGRDGETRFTGLANLRPLQTLQQQQRARVDAVKQYELVSHSTLNDPESGRCDFYTIQHPEDPDRSYLVLVNEAGFHSCDCPARRDHPEKTCKHIAAMIEAHHSEIAGRK